MLAEKKKKERPSVFLLSITLSLQLPQQEPPKAFNGEIDLTIQIFTYPDWLYIDPCRIKIRYRGGNTDAAYYIKESWALIKNDVREILLFAGNNLKPELNQINYIYARVTQR